MRLAVQYRRFFNTTTRFSVICPGSMDRGVQNIRAEAFEQRDFALVHGMNFIDTAVLFPIAPRADPRPRRVRCAGAVLTLSGLHARAYTGGGTGDHCGSAA